ncbi:hypothetical protein K7X08_011910 [Anisodus acutangulus]|uniref:HMG box domain-containing protein n=1 Tax=Anisodus acutangulus TaxID=402998 RepID=A0A9Q1LAB0_9SOLA|nr:hypothetical protein K7X08_011910 [Anisodus acutangulus]
MQIVEAYNRRMTAGYAEEEESDKSRSDVSPSRGSKYGGNPRYTHLGSWISLYMCKQFSEMNSSIESIVVLGAAGGGKWNQMSDAEKATYIAKEKKRKMEYEKRMNAYNRRVAVADTKKDESDESRSEFDDEEVSGEEEEDDNLCNIFDV